MSDSDALWLRNPFLDIEYYAANADIVATRATFPEDLQARLGATVCMGFIYIKANQNIVVLWDELIDHMVKLPNPDDQKILNEIMIKQKLRFPYRLPYERSYEVDHGHLMLQKQTIRVSILPQNSYRRICYPKYRNQILANTTILHCVTRAKKQTIKRLAGEKYGMWLLNESAITTDFKQKKYASYESFMSSITRISPHSLIPNKYALS
jgi:hypothetical protein